MPLVVDNTVATPILLRPIEYGADIVVHSLTKFMGGHGATMGGAIVDGGRFDWAAHARRFPMFSEPDASYHGLVYAEHFGAAAFIARCRSVYQRTTGAVLPPMSAFLLLQGIETVALRVERHVENARKVAEFLRARSARRLGQLRRLSGQPVSIALAQKYLGGRAAPRCSPSASRAGFEAGKTFYDALKLVKRLVNIGDAKSLACHPASTTHRQMTPDEQTEAGVAPETIRLSVGIEHIDDIIEDLDQALAAAADTLAASARGGVGAMSVTIERLSPSDAAADRRRFASGGAGAARSRDRGTTIEIGLVNNMPDAALRADRAAVRRSPRGGRRPLRRARASPLARAMCRAAKRARACDAHLSRRGASPRGAASTR